MFGSNNLPDSLEVISGRYIPQFTRKADKKCNYLKFESDQSHLHVHVHVHALYGKSHQTIIWPTRLESLAKSVIMSKW